MWLCQYMGMPVVSKHMSMFLLFVFLCHYEWFYVFDSIYSETKLIHCIRNPFSSETIWIQSYHNIFIYIKIYAPTSTTIHYNPNHIFFYKIALMVHLYGYPCIIGRTEKIHKTLGNDQDEINSNLQGLFYRAELFLLIRYRYTYS